MIKISGTFLKSKISKRIASLLLIAAIVPALLVTLLSNQKISQLVSNYEHSALLEKNRNHALTVFSNLIFAREKLKDAIDAQASGDTTKGLSEHLSFSLAAGKVNIFRSIVEVPVNSAISISSPNHQISSQDLKRITNMRDEDVEVIVIAKESDKGQPSINLVHRHINNKSQASFIIAELAPEFLWGKLENYSIDLKVCAYQINQTTRTAIFCSNQEKVEHGNIELSPVNHAEWELYLRGEFNAPPWLFTINRISPLTKSHMKEYVGSTAYISIAILSLLIVGFLSLSQIRKTMVPLEMLMKGTKKIASGDFSPVNVSGSLEFAELAESFNTMSSHIKHQLDTLQSFSAIDREIGTNIDVEQVSTLVLQRMEALEPTATFCIALLNERTATELQCNCMIGGHHALSSIRLSITTKEIEAIKRYDAGRISETSLTSELSHERLMAELGTTHIWVLPIFWQGEICAFLMSGSKDKPDHNNRHWSEFRELANRVGMVISAQAREQKLLLEAQYDRLTGLPNRILLQDRLTKAIEHADQTGNPMWVVFIDLDRFKVVNDSMGHSVGDALLTEVGNRLHAEVRETDTVARFGGDEFVVVLSSDVGESMKLNILNRLMESIASPIHINNHELINTCSMGVASYPNDGKNAEMLIKNADIAMYRAKETGRNQYQFFTQSLNDKAAERMQIISLLQKAIQNNELELHYQPKVDLKTNLIIGIEALIRWDSSLLSYVSPSKFIPIAEEAGLIKAIGAWSLKKACAQLAEWEKAGLGNLVMSVNISAKQFQQDDLVESIKSILIETGTKAEHLELEITESLLMDKSSNVLNTLHAIKTLGIQLSIDDFGTGYSSLSYLDTLPIDTVKIDKSFTDTISLNTKESPIVNTIINLAKNLNLKVIAEGTETAEQVTYLKTHGCDQIQGYYFSKPVSATEMKAMLVSGKKLTLPTLHLVKEPHKNTRSKQQ